MAKKSQKSTDPNPIAEAAHEGASVAEAQKIHRLVKKHRLPPGVRTFVVRFGTDSTGDKAVWIRFIIDDELNPAKDRINELNSFRRSVQSELIESNLSVWPYIEFRGDKLVGSQA
jgi:hypothetical protein